MKYLLSLSYLEGTDEQVILADDIMLNGVSLGRRRCDRHEFPGTLPALPMSRASAVRYYLDNTVVELSGRVAQSRVRSFEQRVQALQLLCGYLDTPEGAQTVPAWEAKAQISAPKITLSEDQAAFIGQALELLRI